MNRGLLIAATLLIAAPAAAKDPPVHLYGAQPGWDDYRRIAEAAVTARMIDPESARITWLSGAWKGAYKPLFQPRVQGYIACGAVNAKNRMGGYTGATTFILAIDYDRVLDLQIDARAGSAADTLCAKEIASGVAPPVPAMTPSSPPLGTTAPATIIASGPSAAGLSLRAMPEGAYVTAVTAGSRAAAAGLQPGMVITAVNGIALAGMGDAATKVVDAAGATAALTLVGGIMIKLGAGR